jgi:hypothetical protein
MRADVHDRFRAAAAEMLAIEDTYLARVSKVLVDDQAGEWSGPVRMRFEPFPDGTVDLVFERLEPRREPT